MLRNFKTMGITMRMNTDFGDAGKIQLVARYQHVDAISTFVLPVKASPKTGYARRSAVNVIWEKLLSN